MKLFLAILILSFNVSASVYSQKVSLSYKDASLREVLQSIRKQSGYSFLFTSSVLDVAKPVTVKLDQVDIEKTLQIIFSDQPLNYRIDDKVIVIKSRTQKDSSILQRVKDFFLSITIAGKVVDEDGSPLPGASIKASGKATISNGSGEFSLAGVEEGANVEISYIGYKTLTLKAAKDFITARLQKQAGELNETVIKGYYNTTKVLNTGNVSSVKSADLAKNPVSDPVMALEGRVPGLYVAQTSGIAGGDMVVKLRGQNSIANGNSPLYILDGIPFPSKSLTSGTILGGATGNLSPFANINISDIESIDVLKDADATAIYGSRGANGVILITTKKGKAGKTRFDVNVYKGAGKVASKLDLMNTDQYLTMRRAALANDGVTTIPGSANDLNGNYGDVNHYTDWQKVLIGGTAQVTDAQASISGGSAQTQFLFGGSYHKETTVFPGSYNDKKIAAHLNVTHQSENKRFNSNVMVSYTNDNNQLPTTDFTSQILLAPNTPALYNADGSLNWQNSIWENPLWVTSQKAGAVSTNLNAATNLSYEIIKGLSISARMGYNDIKTNASTINPFVNYDPAVFIDPSYRTNTFGTNEIKSWIIEPGINYSMDLGKGKLESLIGATFQQSDQVSLYQTASGFSSAALINDISSATTTRIARYTDTRYRYNAIYARIGYNYQDKYLINLTGRRDASSRFGPGKQFANLGAIGAAWIVSHMDWMKNILPAVSFAKLRASYGLTGNDQLGDYAFLSTSASNNMAYQGVTGLYPTSLTNSKFGWETVKKLEFGLDLGFLDNRILLNGSWYRNRTGNQLVGYALPDITGFPSIQANLPAVIQNTGTELELTGRIFKGNRFSWTVSGNLTVPKNELVSYPNLAASSYAQTYVEGQPLTVQFLYHYTGIDPTTKAYTFQDFDKDGQITLSNDTRPVNVSQKFFGGLNNSFSYKGLQLDVFFQYVKQNGFNLLGVAPGRFNAVGSNQQAYLLDEVNKGAASSVQQFTSRGSSVAGQAYTVFTNSDAVVGDASFIRLKNVSLSWTLPEKYQHALKLQNARVYLQAQNLLTITNFNGLDPEIPFRGASQLVLPPLKMITLGIQISL
ncbi:SusC/RagA family TonB-linked outer membrane protein [Chitinophaga oryziterrae]